MGPSKSISALSKSYSAKQSINNNTSNNEPKVQPFSTKNAVAKKNTIKPMSTANAKTLLKSATVKALPSKTTGKAPLKMNTISNQKRVGNSLQITIPDNIFVKISNLFSQLTS